MRVDRTGQRHTSLGQTRRVSVRKHRMIARWLRQTAGHTEPTHRLARRRETLLFRRVAAVRAQLLEIAALLEAPSHPPDATYVAALRELLTNGSPAVANGVVYVGSDDGDLYAFDLTTASFAPNRPRRREEVKQ